MIRYEFNSALGDIFCAIFTPTGPPKKLPKTIAPVMYGKMIPTWYMGSGIDSSNRVLKRAKATSTAELTTMTPKEIALAFL